MYFRPRRETVVYNEVVISFQWASKVNVNSRPWEIRLWPGIEFIRRFLVCQVPCLYMIWQHFLYLCPCFILLLPGWPVWKSFKTCFWSVDGIMMHSLYNNTSSHIKKTSVLHWSFTKILLLFGWYTHCGEHFVLFVQASLEVPLLYNKEKFLILHQIEGRQSLDLPVVLCTWELVMTIRPNGRIFSMVGIRFWRSLTGLHHISAVCWLYA